MLRIQSITIEEFRGIRKMSLDIGMANFVVCGPNGTGKSGIVDAIEFVLTGGISRLSGEGTGELTIAKHGPHVDSRTSIERAKVRIEAEIVSLGRVVTIERSIAEPSAFKVTPTDPEVLQIIQAIQSHPEFVLSRREIIKYVLAPPGKRAEEISSLLGLKSLMRLRSILFSISNSGSRKAASAATALAGATEHLRKHVDVPKLTPENLIGLANSRRTILRLPSLATFTESTVLNDGVDGSIKTKTAHLPKLETLAEIERFRKAVSKVTSSIAAAFVEKTTNELNALASDPAMLFVARIEQFYTLGVELIATELCPFCGDEWDITKLTQVVNRKLEHLKSISAQRKSMEKRLSGLSERLAELKLSLTTIQRYAKMSSPAIEMPVSTAFAKQLAMDEVQLSSFLPIDRTLEVLSRFILTPNDLLTEIAKFEAIVQALPDPSRENAARNWLTVATERVGMFWAAKQKSVVANRNNEISQLVYTTFIESNDSVLSDLYRDVEQDFGKLYSMLNRDDEGEFCASLKPEEQSLNLGVDFYGRGKFPPGAYHSEGHQDSMGLCLYLALMRHLQGENFSFAVLDDVLTSIDVGHRREVCRMLKNQFPETQFIITTHDPIWLRLMESEGLVTGRIRFKQWSVDDGPKSFEVGDVWNEVGHHLNLNEVNKAATVLRHHLEYVAHELCDRLHAPVGFRGDASYQLGELLPSAISQLRKLFGKAKNAANSHKQKDLFDEITLIASDFDKAVTESRIEQWQVNTSIHYNSWDNLQTPDFGPVVVAFRGLVGKFGCEKCGGFLRVFPDRETPQFLSCPCGNRNMKLLPK